VAMFWSQTEKITLNFLQSLVKSWSNTDYFF